MIILNLVGVVHKRYREDETEHKETDDSETESVVPEAIERPKKTRKFNKVSKTSEGKFNNLLFIHYEKKNE